MGRLGQIGRRSFKLPAILRPILSPADDLMKGHTMTRLDTIHGAHGRGAGAEQGADQPAAAISRRLWRAYCAIHLRNAQRALRPAISRGSPVMPCAPADAVRQS
ncbi:MAG: hypothetical protein WDN08_14210 [Rhizomicrobium sp.]